jgi:hypothetical protein
MGTEVGIDDEYLSHISMCLNRHRKAAWYYTISFVAIFREKLISKVLHFTGLMIVLGTFSVKKKI